MALHLCLNADGTGLVTDQNPIQTKHTTAGEAAYRAVYIYNDGKRAGLGSSDTNPPALLYTNISVSVEGVTNALRNRASSSDTTLEFNNKIEGWNIGTVLIYQTEKMRINSIEGTNTIVVTRGYESSAVLDIPAEATIAADNKTVSLAIPVPGDYNAIPTNWGVAGNSLREGLDPSALQTNLTAAENDNVVVGSTSGLYSPGSLIRIAQPKQGGGFNEEIMKVLTVNGQNFTVIRGFNGTTRLAHGSGSTITCVGISDVGKTHQFWIKNDPPSGLPTQRKRDVKIVITADEEPA